MQKDVSRVIDHYKTTKSAKPKPSTKIAKRIRDFYHQVNISRQLPEKNLTHKANDFFRLSVIEEGR